MACYFCQRERLREIHGLACSVKTSQTGVVIVRQGWRSIFKTEACLLSVDLQENLPLTSVHHEAKHATTLYTIDVKA